MASHRTNENYPVPRSHAASAERAAAEARKVSSLFSSFSRNTHCQSCRQALKDSQRANAESRAAYQQIAEEFATLKAQVAANAEVQKQKVARETRQPVIHAAKHFAIMHEPWLPNQNASAFEVALADDFEQDERFDSKEGLLQGVARDLRQVLPATFHNEISSRKFSRGVCASSFVRFPSCN